MTAEPKPRGLAPAKRAQATKEAFEAKVLILEQWARDGIPGHEDFYPKNHVALRAWTGPKYEDLPVSERPHPLGTWTDPKIDRPALGPNGRPIGKYPDLIFRYQAAVAGIEKGLKRKADRLAALKAANDTLKTQVTNLTEQNDYLAGEIERLEFVLRTTKDLAKGHVRTIDKQAFEIRELWQKLRDLHAILEQDAGIRLEHDGEFR